jgi:hypothetical protein
MRRQCNLDAAVAKKAESMNVLNDVRVAGKIEAEKSFGAQGKVRPELSG